MGDSSRLAVGVTARSGQHRPARLARRRTGACAFLATDMLDPDEIKGLPSLQAEGVALKYMSADPSPDQLESLIQLCCARGSRLLAVSGWFAQTRRQSYRRAHRSDRRAPWIRSPSAASMTSWSLTRESLSGTRRSSSRRDDRSRYQCALREDEAVLDAAVHHWFLSQHAHDVYPEAITEAEILHGIALMPSGKRKQALGTAAARARPVWRSGLALRQCRRAGSADIVVRRRRLGRRIETFDAQIEAIVRSRGMTLATRDAQDLAGVGIPIVAPWQP